MPIHNGPVVKMLHPLSKFVYMDLYCLKKNVVNTVDNLYIVSLNLLALSTPLAEVDCHN